MPMIKAVLPADAGNNAQVGLVLALHRLRTVQSWDNPKLCTKLGVNIEELNDLLCGLEVSSAVSVRARTFLLDVI